MSKKTIDLDTIQYAKSIIEAEAHSLSRMANLIDGEFESAVKILKDLKPRGRVVICGIGKSGLIGRKIAATLASTGTPSFFVHPSEAYHGDLGMIQPGDIIIAISNSGEGAEINGLFHYLKNNEIPIIAMTGCPESTLGKFANATLNISAGKEACPHNLAPTSSAINTMSMGDALSLTLMKMKDFGPMDYAVYHPGGALGRRLLNSVRDHMKTSNLPEVSIEDDFLYSLSAITNCRMGCAIVVDEQKHVQGIVSDGDLRRHLTRNGSKDATVRMFYNSKPICINENSKIETAISLMTDRKINFLPAINQNNKLVGILHLLDCHA